MVHKSCDEGRINVDSLLLTVTVFGETLDSPKLPVDGSIIRIANSRKRLVYEAKFCQLVARCSDIIIE
jgi:hypothetical protein